MWKETVVVKAIPDFSGSRERLIGTLKDVLEPHNLEFVLKIVITADQIKIHKLTEVN